MTVRGEMKCTVFHHLAAKMGSVVPFRYAAVSQDPYDAVSCDLADDVIHFSIFKIEIG